MVSVNIIDCVYLAWAVCSVCVCACECKGVGISCNMRGNCIMLALELGIEE